MMVSKNKNILVGIVMGSQSDWEVMKKAKDQLDEFSISNEQLIISAHRTPHRIVDYAEKVLENGVKVIIAGAGGAAHLPGMVASMTTLPVIGVPVKTSTLSGVDSLYSIVQMPRGVPVATVAIGNAKNAGILAAKILGIENEGLAAKIVKFMQNQTKEVMVKAKKLERMGWKDYLDEYEEKKSRAAPKRNTAVGV